MDQEHNGNFTKRIFSELENETIWDLVAIQMSNARRRGIVDVNRVFIPCDNEGRVQESTPRSL